MPSLATRAIAAPLAAALGSVARRRQARAFHPRGVARHAQLRIDAGDHPVAGLAGTHPAIVRTSRGLGLPAALPDIWGLAVRLLGSAATAGPALEGRDADVLLATTGSGAIGRHLLAPARRPGGRTFSSLLPFAAAGGARFVLGARPTVGDADRAGDEVELLVAEVGGPWRVVGHLVLAGRLPDADGQALRFSPWRTPPGIELAGRLNDLRRPAYRASQAARPDTDQPS